MKTWIEINGERLATDTPLLWARARAALKKAGLPKALEFTSKNGAIVTTGCFGERRPARDNDRRDRRR